MTTSAAEWLAQNSIDCAPLGARISKEQCKANHGHTFACEDCPHGGVKFVGPAKVIKPNRNQLPPAPVDQSDMVPVIATKEKTMTKLAKGTCLTCKRPDVTLTQTKTRDCFRCYDRIKKGKDPITGLPVTAQGAAAPPAAATPPPFCRESPHRLHQHRTMHYRCGSDPGRSSGGETGCYGAAAERLKKHLFPSGTGPRFCGAPQLDRSLTWGA